MGFRRVLQARSWLPRTEGTIRLGFARRGERSHIEVLHQRGAARVRFPRAAEGGDIEAVLVNTAGGLTGGDRMEVAVALSAGSEATLTSAAAEKLYRARDEQPAIILVNLTLAAGARLSWLPQPTIVFNGARLDRRTEVWLGRDGRLLATEFIVFGRAAMGEEVVRGAVRDVWRVHREGALIFAEAFRLEGAIAAALQRKATLAGARAMALLIYAAPDAANRCSEARQRVQRIEGVAGASAWNGLLVMRAVAEDASTLQRDVAALIEWLSGRPLPRVWRC
jgi:urease accessory protein